MNEVVTPTEIDDTIQRVETLYRSMTGKDAPAAESAYAPIPAEEDPTRHVEEQLDRLLALLGPSPTPPLGPPSWTPPMQVMESETEVVVFLDLPGVSRDRVTVRQQGEVLTVSGERPTPGSGNTRLRLNERPLGSFRRTLWVPTRPADLTAQMKEGVLEIRMRKEIRTEAQNRTIQVN
jgi:HSP20 family molecular chaperone IbpA